MRTDETLVCGEPMVVTEPFERDVVPCPNECGWLITFAEGSVLRIVGYCPDHIGGGISHCLDSPDIETFTVTVVT